MRQVYVPEMERTLALVAVFIMDNTYLALFRKIEDSFVYQDSELLHLWIHCLIKASYTDRDIMFDGAEIELKKGQFITGRKSLAKTLKTTEQKIRSRLALLEKHNQIVVKSTNKYSIITIVKYSYYQTDPKKITNREPTDNQQITTNNKDNKDNNIIGNQLPLDDMSWNKQIEEVIIDADTGEEVKPKEKPKRHFKEVYTVFEEVLGKLPANWFVNTTQQKCADNLFTERGITAIRNALQFYKENKEKEFCPQITQPSDLDAKWSKLGEFKKKLQ